MCFSSNKVYFLVLLGTRLNKSRNARCSGLAPQHWDRDSPEPVSDVTKNSQRKSEGRLQQPSRGDAQGLTTNPCEQRSESRWRLRLGCILPQKHPASSTSLIIFGVSGSQCLPGFRLGWMRRFTVFTLSTRGLDFFTRASCFRVKIGSRRRH